ncbi:Glycosyl transferase family 2 [Peptoclostridium litorale DSM 5388]|uniref:Glycosyl transferase family 2 n=1 Tax=Peptoclostridium litorale DSM 5388 TaxID=1121324 RepID=A0A069RHK8_PEPLI|nr:glycosyltransferase family 2 protein [Peptoclostridium litorale]KDR95605.1 glycosyl transferase family 2 [Peptoclostridium litorale DSM 5388]SIN99256.1 Glycosyl transferase family 2 [Peptoclostridium litorale DSM 5388]
MDSSNKNPFGRYSVAIAFSTYNNSPHVKNTIDSILSQNHSNIYVSIADDGSHDNTVNDIYESLSSFDRFSISKLDHGERGIARKTSIDNALDKSPDFIFIIDSDMVLKENLLTDVLAFFEKKPNVGALVIPEIPFSLHKNYFSKVKVFERSIINNAGSDIGKNSIEAARFWRTDEYIRSGGIDSSQISFEETQPTIRYMESGGIIKRALFTGVYHDEKKVTFQNIISKKRYYFSHMDKTIENEERGFLKALSRWYFFRPVLYRWINIKKYIRHPLLFMGMLWMYMCLSAVGAFEMAKSAAKKA